MRWTYPSGQLCTCHAPYDIFQILRYKENRCPSHARSPNDKLGPPSASLVTQVMTQPPYRDADRVFWILDNSSSHRGAPCVRRLQAACGSSLPPFMFLARTTRSLVCTGAP